jgi:hypothetical protein
MRTLVAATIVTLLLLELGCYWYLTSNYYKSKTIDSESFDREFNSKLPLYTDEKIEEIKNTAWDSELGHTNFPNTAFTRKNVAEKQYTMSFDSKAARQLPLSGEVVASSYGDSFTLCDEVNDDETWQYVLSKEIGARVENFGVGAYGSDQALMRLHSLRKRGMDQAPRVIFSIWAENINRIHVMYYGFYMLGTVGFKPMYVLSGDLVKLQPNPLHVFKGQQDLKLAYETSKHFDRWYQIRRGPEVGFPFAFSGFRAVLHTLQQKQQIRAIADYQDWESVAKLEHILLGFLSLSEEYCFEPVVIFIPTAADLRREVSRRDDGYRGFVKRVRRDDRFKNLRLIDLLDENFQVDKFNIKPFEGHASLYGNTVIATILRDRLKLRPDQKQHKTQGECKKISSTTVH